MDSTTARRFGVALGLAAGLVLVAGGTGLAFAGWVDHGPRLFMALVESGLNCF